MSAGDSTPPNPDRAISIAKQLFDMDFKIAPNTTGTEAEKRDASTGKFAEFYTAVDNDLFYAKRTMVSSSTGVAYNTSKEQTMDVIFARDFAVENVTQHFKSLPRLLQDIAEGKTVDPEKLRSTYSTIEALRINSAHRSATSRSLIRSDVAKLLANNGNAQLRPGEAPFSPSEFQGDGARLHYQHAYIAEGLIKVQAGLMGILQSLNIDIPVVDPFGNKSGPGGASGGRPR